MLLNSLEWLGGKTTSKKSTSAILKANGSVYSSIPWTLLLSAQQRLSISTIPQKSSTKQVNILSNLDCQVIGCSVDSHYSHREWALKPKSEGGLAPLNIPLLSDITKRISKAYHVLVCNENDGLNGVALRGTFIIDDKGILRHSSVNDAPVGRNVDEILRTLKALQHTDKHGEVCPARWEPGKKTVLTFNFR
jgi:alkyl hydroperoxide reductase subunit AhpC